MSSNQLSRTPIQAIVKSHLPEYIREDYPMFVSFVEAYYEYMQQQNIDIVKVRDLDSTLDEFVGQFKKELAYNIPSFLKDERFLLTKVKEQYLAKGSRASYDLLFKLLYGKNAELFYPGERLLIPSDGRWNQEISVFAQVDYGDANDVVGKLVDIVSAGTILRVVVDKKQDFFGEVDKIVRIGKYFEIISFGISGQNKLNVSTTAGIEVGQRVTAQGIPLGTRVIEIEGNTVTLSAELLQEVDGLVVFSNELYEFFLDKRFFGQVKPGDLLKFSDTFQATIVPVTAKIKIVQPGKNFRVGQVFELRSGSGTGALMKVTGTTSTGGIKYAELIKFGIGYTTNFSLSLLSTNSVTSTEQQSSVGSTLLISDLYVSDGPGQITATLDSRTVTGISTNYGLTGNVTVGDEIWTDELTSRFVGTVTSIESTTSLTIADSCLFSYSGNYLFKNSRGIGTETGSLYKPGLLSNIAGFNEQGYINFANYVDASYVDGTYVGELETEFSLSFRNAQVEEEEPAIIQISLGSIAKYPGYFDTNNGFLDDSIFIQDSYYYQKYSYVVKIDERLNTYKSIVKTLVHPSGMALFGEYDIINYFDLSVDLESLIKFVNLPLIEEVFDVSDNSSLETSKTESDNIDLSSFNYYQLLKSLESDVPINDDLPYIDSIKNETSFIELSDLDVKHILKSITISQAIEDSNVFFLEKQISNEQNLDVILNFSLFKEVTSDVTQIDQHELNFVKQLLSEVSFDSSILVQLSVGLNTTVDILDSSVLFTIDKNLTSEQQITDDHSILITTAQIDEFSTNDDIYVFELSKQVSSNISLETTILVEPSTGLFSNIENIIDEIQTKELGKTIENEQTIVDTTVININVSKESSTEEFSELGYVQLNPYYGQDYVSADENYSVGSRESTFN
jgi:hypothetical protein